MTARRMLLIASYALPALLLGIGIWMALPARWWPVDLVGTGLAIGCGVAAVALGVGYERAERLCRAVSWALLGCGAATTTALAWTAAHLAGLYGPVGSGGALLMGAVATLIVPYLVGVPMLQLSALRRGRS